MLIPLDGTFTRRQEAIPVAVQKTDKHSDQSDLMQRWENGPGYMFLESADEQEELARYLKDRETEGVKSVPTMIRSTFSGLRPARLRASFAAGTARSDVAQVSGRRSAA